MKISKEIYCWISFCFENFQSNRKLKNKKCDGISFIFLFFCESVSSPKIRYYTVELKKKHSLQKQTLLSSRSVLSKVVGIRQFYSFFLGGNQTVWHLWSLVQYKLMKLKSYLSPGWTLQGRARRWCFYFPFYWCR